MSGITFEEQETLISLRHSERVAILYTTQRTIYEKWIERLGSRTEGLKLKEAENCYEIELPMSMLSKPWMVIKRERSEEEKERDRLNGIRLHQARSSGAKTA